MQATKTMAKGLFETKSFSSFRKYNVLEKYSSYF